MLLELTPDFRPQGYDVCIIGAGAAGIVLARKLAREGQSVLLAEAGGVEYSEESQSIYRGEVIGGPYLDLDLARLRYFGGSTNHWGGVCHTLDPRDFEPKAYTDYTAWPIGPDDLAPYLDETLEILGLDPIPADVPVQGTDDLQQMFWGYAERLRLGEEYLEEISNDRNFTVLLNANFNGFEIDDERIVFAKFYNYAKQPVDISASFYVLACGGIENSRILLMENAKWNDALGNSSDLVGKYFIEHPHFTIGAHFLYRDHLFAPTDDAEFNLVPTAAFMERTEILNCRLTLDLPRSRPGLRGFVETTMCDVAPELSADLMEAMGRRFICGGAVRATWEQEPRADNRIALADDVDSFGNPRVQMIWQNSELDKRTFTTFALRVAEYLAAVDGGRLRLYDWVLDPQGAYPADDRLAGRHHMGGTRMAASPRDGVVDRDCRVFGMPNLFVAGSSVFPTGGQSNPTMTIVQLSLRLADQLSAELRDA